MREIKYILYNKATGNIVKTCVGGVLTNLLFTDKESAKDYIRNKMLDKWMEEYDIMEEPAWMEYDITEEPATVKFQYGKEEDL